MRAFYAWRFDIEFCLVLKEIEMAKDAFFIAVEPRGFDAAVGAFKGSALDEADPNEKELLFFIESNLINRPVAI